MADNVVFPIEKQLIQNCKGFHVFIRNHFSCTPTTKYTTFMTLVLLNFINMYVFTKISALYTTRQKKIYVCKQTIINIKIEPIYTFGIIIHIYFALVTFGEYNYRYFSNLASVVRATDLSYSKLLTCLYPELFSQNGASKKIRVC